jgi:hypothetical protein
MKTFSGFFSAAEAWPQTSAKSTKPVSRSFSDDFMVFSKFTGELQPSALWRCTRL